MEETKIVMITPLVLEYREISQEAKYVRKRRSIRNILHNLKRRWNEWWTELTTYEETIVPETSKTIYSKAFHYDHFVDYSKDEKSVGRKRNR